MSQAMYPIYRKQDLSNDDGRTSVAYSRVGRDLTEFCIHITRDFSIHITRDFSVEIETVELEISPNAGIDPRSMDYSLGRGKYASSKDEFDAALRAAVLFLERFRDDGQD